MLPRPRLQEQFAYHPPVLKKVASPAEKLLQAVLVAVIGTGLGIGVGVFLAGRTLPSDTSGTVKQPQAAEPTKPVEDARSLPQTSALAGKAVQAGLALLQAKHATVDKLAPVATPVTATTSRPHQPLLVWASLTTIRGRFRHRHGLHHKVVQAPTMALKPKTLAPVEEARLEIPDGRFRFTIEGDQTAVAYDAQSGVVSTDGSGLFVVEKAPGEVLTVRSQESRSNVHYKCDQDANCSLVMASVVVPHARMRTVSRSIDWAYVPTGADGQARDATQAPVYFGHVSR
jgi:hypothetical protein